LGCCRRKWVERETVGWWIFDSWEFRGLPFQTGKENAGRKKGGGGAEKKRPDGGFGENCRISVEKTKEKKMGE